VFRKDLIELLKARPIALHELALLIDCAPRDLEDDLRHLFRSLRSDPLCPVITPARCRACGFEFHATGCASPESARAAGAPGSASR
jgi:predicted Zn-ribbon and HTH transcriptional regulator